VRIEQSPIGEIDFVPPGDSAYTNIDGYRAHRILGHGRRFEFSRACTRRASASARNSYYSPGIFIRRRASYIRTTVRARALAHAIFRFGMFSYFFFFFSSLSVFFPSSHPFPRPRPPPSPLFAFFLPPSAALTAFPHRAGKQRKKKERQREREKKKKKEERNKISTAVAGGIGRRGHSPATIRQPSRYLSRIEIRRPRRRNFIKITAQILERANDGGA